MTDPCVPLVLFLHGPAGDPSDYDAVAGRLPERFRARVPHLPWDATGLPRELAMQLGGEVRGESRPLVLVADAHAGYVGLELARRRRHGVRGLVLSGCSDDPRDGFGKVDAPVLLRWGTEDRFTPAAVGRRLREALPGARLLFILEAGHRPMVDRPAVYAFHLASFLNDLAPERIPPSRLAEEAA